jgi:23S rRNA pseudouridine1911/1915/1917 synthase
MVEVYFPKTLKVRIKNNFMKYIAPTNLPILEVLTVLFPASSKNTLRSWVKEGRVFADNTVIKNSSVEILAGQTVTIGKKTKEIRRGIPILFEDEDIVVVDKPTGLLSVSTAFEKGETMFSLIKKYYPSKKVCVVHRLDQDTSGVMVFALHEEACERLKALFEVHNIERVYTAVVEGCMSKDSGTWTSYQYEDSQYVVHETMDPEKGKKAITHYKVIDSSAKYSLLELRLETGRKNQIRVHCQTAGHSVLGDKKYGAIANPLKRLCLHAHLLAFQHPFSKKPLKFESPAPQEFSNLLRHKRRVK